MAARRRNPPRAHARDLSEDGGHPTITALEAWDLLGAKPEHRPRAGAAPASGPQLWLLNLRGVLVADAEWAAALERQPLLR